MNIKLAATLALALLASRPAHCAPADALASSDEVQNGLSAIRAALQQKSGGAPAWQAGVTSMARLSIDSQLARLGGTPSSAERPAALFAGQDKIGAPSIDWRSGPGGSYVTPIKDQGSCGSCWAFATTAALESYTLRAREAPGATLDLSEQVLVSCGGGGSCGGGYVSAADDFIQNVGLPDEGYFPYRGVDAPCSAWPGWRQRTLRAGRWLGVGHDVASLKDALAQAGPIVATMKVFFDFYFYQRGVYRHVSGLEMGWHAILLVGYDDASGAFIAKNSWGTGWGEEGFFRIAYSEVLGDAQLADYATVFEPRSPSPVRVRIATPRQNGVAASNGAAAGDSGVTGDTRILAVDASIDGGTYSRIAAEGGVWSLALPALADGRHTLTVRASDNAGNRGAASVSFTVGATPPAADDSTDDESRRFRRFRVTRR